MNDEELKELIKKYVLKNAKSFGKASESAVIGKIIAERPELKNNIKEVLELVKKIVNEVNSLSQEEIESELKNYSFEENKKREEEGKKISLPNAEMGKVVTRFPPEPSGYPHIGHAKAALLDYESAKAYNGEMILRFDDTNPEKEDWEFVNAFREGLKWLNVEWSKETFSSDYMEIFYHFAEQLIKNGHAYICTCSQEEIKKGRESGKECSCRDLNADENLKRWKIMFSSKENEAIVRLKGDMKDLNTAFRDPTLFRIIETPHYKHKNKYKVWPTYDFAAPILDSIEGVTHAMRSKEYELRDKVYFTILERLKLRKPILISFSRLSIKNSLTSKRLIIQLVKKGLVSGWDDPRLTTLHALKRRGISPLALRNFLLSFGFSKSDSEVSLDKILAENRKILEPTVKHFFFVPNPIKLEIVNFKEENVKIPLFSSKTSEFREIKVGNSIFISESDFLSLEENEVFRFKDWKNAKIIDKKNRKVVLCDSEKVDKKIQWIGTENVKVKVLKPNNLLNDDGTFNENSLEIVLGLAEKNIKVLKINEVVQFERFGLCKLDRIEEETFIFIFTS